MFNQFSQCKCWVTALIEHCRQYAEWLGSGFIRCLLIFKLETKWCYLHLIIFPDIHLDCTVLCNNIQSSCGIMIYSFSRDHITYFTDITLCSQTLILPTLIFVPGRGINSHGKWIQQKKIILYDFNRTHTHFSKCKVYNVVISTAHI